MLTLVNTNRMLPPIAPLGLEYVAGAVKRAGLAAEVLDLCLTPEPEQALAEHFSRRNPELVGLSFRNTDDSYWPSAQSFVPNLQAVVAGVRRSTPAPVVLGGVGFSLFAEELVAEVGADYGVRGDGEEAVVALARELRGEGRLERVPGLVWRAGGALRSNPPAWPEALTLSSARDVLDNRSYFQRGGQVGLETKRGCDRVCTYCADALAKGALARTRDPSEVADEVEALLRQGVDVLHLCDSEFNVPPQHAAAVCEALIRRGLGDRVRWYTYMAVFPFDSDLAGKMRRAGCRGINFSGDSASPAMLRSYRQPHGPSELQRAVELCRANGISVMVDLLLGGPGETPETVAETVDFIKRIDPDCAGAALGVRLYPGTEVTRSLRLRGPLEKDPGVRRAYPGPVDLLRPTFYVSPALGPRPARTVRELIGGDPRFFEPSDDEAPPRGGGDHNYNDNNALADAIAGGARGAYWDVLRRLRRAP